MRARLGDHPVPATALLDRHVRHFDAALTEAYLTASSAEQRRLHALAGLLNLVLWLGWLRSSEALGLRFEDIQAHRPGPNPPLDLPSHTGCLILTLAPETKSSRSSSVDVVLAWHTRSGLSIGVWWTRILRHTSVPSGFIFRHPHGACWTSLDFRQQFLYPSLHEQRAQGDSFLSTFTPTPGNSIPEKFWSLHCYRRGARSQVTRGGTHAGFRFRKATAEQIYEHARWRLRRSGENVATLYREWTIRDRLFLTLLSM